LNARSRSLKKTWRREIIQQVRGNPDQELKRIKDQGLKNNTHLVKWKIEESISRRIFKKLHLNESKIAFLRYFWKVLKVEILLRVRLRLSHIFGSVQLGKECNLFFNGSIQNILFRTVLSTEIVKNSSKKSGIFPLSILINEKIWKDRNFQNF